MSDDDAGHRSIRRTIGKVMIGIAALLILIPVGYAAYEAVTDRDRDAPLINIEIG